VAAAFCGALLGVAPFWIRHCGIPFASPGPGQRRGTRNGKLVFLVLNLDLVSQTRQRIPTRIRRSLFAGADC
jgi:hypothetical protein